MLYVKRHLVQVSSAKGKKMKIKNRKVKTQISKENHVLRQPKVNRYHVTKEISSEGGKKGWVGSGDL